MSQTSSKTISSKSEAGFTLFEMIVTLVVLSILVLGTVPIAQNAVIRGKEERLRQSLAIMRAAIDEFRRDVVGACGMGQVTSSNPTVPGMSNIAIDPRSKVVIDDCAIFDVLNPDRLPPSLELLTQGVRVKARGFAMGTGTVILDGNATDSNATQEIKKIYLRSIPIDPMTGRNDTWRILSSYQTADSETWDGMNVFDVRSGSEQESLAGEKYSDW